MRIECNRIIKVCVGSKPICSATSNLGRPIVDKLTVQGTFACSQAAHYLIGP